MNLTGTTVGYDDITPTVSMTRFLGVIVAIIGIVFTGIVASISLEAAKIAVENRISLQDLWPSVKEETKR